MREKKICVITGTRAEYGIFQLLLKKINESKKLQLCLLVTGTHLIEHLGSTVNQIKDDGFKIDGIIPMYDQRENKKQYYGRALGRAIIGFTDELIKLKPDLLLVLGDRYEPMAAVLAASTLSIPIAHIHGGDNVFKGQIDEQIRHSITKFSHIHFPATPKSAERIKLLGEEDWRIHMVGSPSIDMIYQEKFLKKEDLCRKFGLISTEKIIICIYHSYIFESEKAGEYMKTILQVLEELNLQTVIIYPNNDPGSNLIIKEINAKKGIQKFKIFKNLKRIDYLNLLKNADLLIGNSSSGIIESPIFKLPVINIGNRNKGRESAENVINISHDYNEIKNAIDKVFSKEFQESCQNIMNPYGDGKASEQIIEVLEELEINKELLIKKLTYDI